MSGKVDDVLPGHNRRRSGSIDESALPNGRRRRHSRQSTFSEEQLKQLDRIGSDFRLQRDLQRALAELSAREEEFREAVDIQTRLEQENEDLLAQMDQMTQQLSDQMIHIKVLQQKCDTLEELYNDEHARYEAEIKDKDDQITSMEQELIEKEGDMEELVQELENQQTKVHENLEDVLRQNSTESNVNDLEAVLNASPNDAASSGSKTPTLDFSTDLERELYTRLMEERKKSKDTSRTVDKLMMKLEKANRMAAEYDNVQAELEELRSAQNDDIERANMTNKAISEEIVSLAKRNAALQQEIEDLQNVLEDKDYQMRMLEAELEMDRGETAREFGGGLGSLGDDLVKVLQQEQQELRRQTQSEAPRLSAAKMGSVGEQQNNEEQKKEEDVPDVLKEYLHLTASAVKIKFPNVTEITSEQLIEKMQKLSFFQYHDAMVRIMKHEEAKIKQREQEKLEKEKKQKQQEAEKQQQNQSVFGRIAAFFTNGADEEAPRQHADRDFQSVAPVQAQTRRTQHRVT